MRRTVCSFFVVLTLGAAAAHAQYYTDPPLELVRSWYARFLGRVTSERGMLGWIQALRQGQAPEHVLSGILGSAEYYNRSGMTSAGFVRNLYRDLLGREPSPEEFAYALRRLRFDTPQTVAYEVLLRHPGSWRIPAYSNPGDEPLHDYRVPFSQWPRR